MTQLSVSVETGQTIEPVRVLEHPYRALGSFRFLLACFVLISHSSGYLPSFVATLALGNVGVLLFFVVSGFVIAEALDLFYRQSITKFLLNRALKIYPAYWAAVPIAYVTHYWAGEAVRADPLGLLVNASLLLSYFPIGNNLLALSIAWAVVVEFQFYFAAAAVFLVARAWREVPVVALAAASALAVYVLVRWTGGTTRFYGAFQFAPFFVLGALLYVQVLRRDIRLLIPLTVAFLASVDAYYTYNKPELGTDHLGLMMSTGIYIALFGTMTVLTTTTFSDRAERIDKRLGDLTYSIYLVHTCMISSAVALGLVGPVAFVFVALSSFAVASAIHVWVERPVVRLRDKLRGLKLYSR